MTDLTAQSDTRLAAEVLIESLEGADRVSIDTWKDLGEVDSHHMPSPAILASLLAMVERLEKAEALAEAAAYALKNPKTLHSAVYAALAAYRGEDG